VQAHALTLRAAMLSDLLLGNYKTVAERLGLTVQGARIHGVVQGIALQMWFGAHATHVGALLPSTAPVELSIVTKGLVGKLQDLFTAHAGGLGDAEFDKIFALRAADPARVSSLLDAESRKVLLEIAKEGYHPAIDPHSIHLRRFSQGGLADSEQKIERDFYETARLARVIGESFARAQA
jgi:hypothetical protein